MALTKRQKEVLDYLVGFQNKNGYSPSYLEIAGAMKLSSLATVHKHLSTLERKGFVRRGYNQSRSIEITQLPKPIRDQVIERHSTSLPLMGRIAAGRPLEAIEERESISMADFSRGPNTFVLKVRGDSMRDEHIVDGDYVLVEHTSTARQGEIIVALVRGSETTLKRYYIEGATVRLQPSNAEMEPIYIPLSQIAIQGRVLGVLRRYA